MDRRAFIATGTGAAVAALLPPTALSALQPGTAARVQPLPFPKDFHWGVSTAAYQVEGAWNLDGKGESVWDRFTHTPSMIKAAATGDVACDTYHRYRDDLLLMKSLHVRSYRFSVAWPRVVPDGAGAVNAKGLDYYDRLTDAVLEQGIRPVCTLYHWDLPQALYPQGAWRSPETVAAFLRYVEIVAKKLGDRIATWCVFNEPTVFARGAYGYPLDAPEKHSFTEALRAQHNVNLAFADSLRAIKAISPHAQVGNGLAMNPTDPASDTDADRAACKRFDAWQNLWFLEPAISGKYPAAFVGEVPLEAMGFRPGDETRLKATPDWIGINYYNREMVAARPVSADAKAPEARLGFNVARGMQGPITDKGWEVWPRGLHAICKSISDRYGLPIEITENGAAYDDSPDATGRIPDHQRVAYYRDHLRELARAIHDGAKVRGYHAWSFLDNFEWADGYTQRFGLVYVDFRDQRRIVKDSGHWYADVIASNAVPGE